MRLFNATGASAEERERNLRDRGRPEHPNEADPIRGARVGSPHPRNHTSVGQDRFGRAAVYPKTQDVTVGVRVPNRESEFLTVTCPEVRSEGRDMVRFCGSKDHAFANGFE